MNLENYFAFSSITLFLLFGLVGLIFLSKNLIKSTWDYFFNKWEITIKEQGSETWCKNYDSSHPANYINNRYGKIPGGEYERDFVVYLHKNKFNKEEKLVKKYLN